jgi:uncharacterized RDD family membrane protein YckC
MSTPVPYSPAGADVSGVLAGRAMAWFVDLVVVGMLWMVFVTVLFVLGVVTFGLTWYLIAPLWPLLAVIYSGITVSGPKRGTIGMRLFGVELRTQQGETASFVVAAVHAVFFYVTVSVLTPLILLVGLFNRERRLAHDFLAGMVATRKAS